MAIRREVITLQVSQNDHPRLPVRKSGNADATFQVSFRTKAEIR
jgi:hypothetical protein